MTKIESNEIDVKEAKEWNFPDFSPLLKVAHNLTNAFVYTHETKPSQEKLLEEQLRESLKKLDIEKEKLKHEYEHKIELLNKLLVGIENSMSVFDNELIDLLQDITKSVVKKVIFKELKLNPKLYHKIIDELKKIIPNQCGAVTVYVSEADYLILKSLKSNATITLSPDSNLAEGDIVIKSNFTQIRSILHERIDKIMQVTK